MTGEIDAAGDAITGALIARAVEPAHGEPGHGEQREGESGTGGHGPCLNCGAPLMGAYCAQCGQAAHLHRSFSAIGHDLAHGVLHFEGKIWDTLPELALRPGTLTRRYIHGQRARFVSPFALFLFSAFLMYAIFSLTSHHGAETGKMVQMDAGEMAELRQEEARADAQVAKAEAALKAPGLNADQRAALTERLDDARAERKAVSMASGLTDALSGEGMNYGIASTVGATISAAAKDPEFAYYKLKANAYKFSWALILFSIPFVWLLFPFRREYKMYDHAIYVTYSIAFMSLLFSISMLLSALHVTTGLATTALLLFAAWHMYRQMKDAYALSRMGALWRLPLLYMFACVALALFFTMLVMMG
ncbi:MAG: DUF3667 domain-containing protein [bacterium]|nr:DUF3667 domain-containing protein [bacterium]